MRPFGTSHDMEEFSEFLPKLGENGPFTSITTGWNGVSHDFQTSCHATKPGPGMFLGNTWQTNGFERLLFSGNLIIATVRKMAHLKDV